MKHRCRARLRPRLPLPNKRGINSAAIRRTNCVAWRAETAAHANRLTQTIAVVLDIALEPVTTETAQEPAEPSLFAESATVEQKADPIFNHMAAFMGRSLA